MNNEFSYDDIITCGSNIHIDPGHAARALGSADVENFHSILNHLDRRGVQTSTMVELNSQMSTMQTLHVLKRNSVVARLVDSKFITN